MEYIRAFFRAPANRNLSTGIGFFLLAVALAPGVILPLMIPLLLAAEYYFACGEGRYYVWFRDHKRLGAWLRAYHAYGIPPLAKLAACSSVTLWVAVVALMADGAEWEYMVVYWIASTVTILLLPYRRHPRA